LHAFRFLAKGTLRKIREGSDVTPFRAIQLCNALPRILSGEWGPT